MVTLPSLLPRAEGPRTRLRPALIAAFAVGLSLPAAAQSATDSDQVSSSDRSWHLSGFGSLGLVHGEVSQPWRFAREITQRGADGDTSVLPDSRLGLQLNWQPAARWEVVAQAVLRQRAKNVRADETLEMGFAAWQPAAGWTLRAGRVKPDLFLLNNVRDVGYALPWARPNVEFYGWNPTTSLNGGTLAYDWSVAEAQWTAQIWAGEMRSTLGALRTDTSVRWKGRNTLGFTLSRVAGGLTLKASVLQTHTVLVPEDDLAQLEGALTQLAQLPLPQVADSAAALYQWLIPDGRTRYLGVGAEYDSSLWLATAELSHVTVDRGLIGGTRGYASFGRHWGAFTGYVMAAFSQPQHAQPLMQGDWATSLTPLLGSAGAQEAAVAGSYAEAYAADARFDQHTLSLGMRWEVFNRAALKLQFDRTWVDAFGAGQWRHGDSHAAKASILSAVLDWVF